MSPVVLLLLLASARAATPITLLTNLTLRVPAETDSFIELDYMITGQNLTYKIDGTYTDASGNPVQAPLPTVDQRMKFVTKVPKSTPTTMNANYSQIVENSNQGNLIYTIDDGHISTWDISNISAPLLKATSPDFYKGDPITSLGFFTSGGRSLLVLLTIVDLVATLGVADTTAVTSTSIVTSLTNQFTLPGAFRTAQFAQTASSMYATVTTTSTVEVYMLPLSLTKKFSFVYSITAAEMGVSSLSPVFAGLEGDQGVICEPNLGVVIFNSTALLEPQPQYQSIVTDNSPLQVGTPLACAYSNYYLAVSTTGGLVVYDVISTSLAPLNQYPRYLHTNEVDALYAVAGLTLPYYLAEYEVSQLKDGTNVTTLRIYEDFFDDLEHAIICDEWNEALFGQDVQTNPTPAFFPYYLPPFDYLIFNSYSALYVFSLSISTTLDMEARLQEAFTFSGNLQVSNDEQVQDWVSFPLHISGLDSESATIYTERGMLPGTYLQPTHISSYIESGNSFYLPLSNYLMGHNLTYTVVNSGDANITVDLPPLYSFVDSYSFTGSSVDTTIVQIRDRVAVIHSTSVAVFDISSTPQLMATLQPTHQPSVGLSKVFSIAGLGCGEDLELLVESGYQDPNSGLFNITWDFYSVSQTPALLFSHEFPQSTPSLSLTAAACSVFALQGSAVLGYAVNSTDWTLQMGTIVTGNLVCAPVNPISIALSLDSSTLFMYDLTLGLFSANVSDIFESEFPCTSIQGSVLSPNPSIRLETSKNFLYLLSPLAGALPQLIQYDISDLQDVEQTIYYPSFGQCTYSDVAATEAVLAVMCLKGSNTNVLIFDPFAMSYESLYVAFSASEGSVYTYLSPENIIYVLTYDGQQIKRYSLVQQGSNWNPSSPLVPSDDQSLSVWARVNFDINNARLKYSAALTITAQSGLSGLSSVTRVNVTLENPGTYIYVGSSALISRLTDGGEFQVGNASVAVGLPDMVFSGGDIQYELIVERNNSPFSIEPTATCEPSTDPCMLPKYTLVQTLGGYSFDALTEFGTGLLAAGNNSLILLQQTGGEWQVAKTMELSFANVAANCNYLENLVNSDLLLASCYNDADFFIAVLNLATLSTTPLYQVSFPPQFVSSSYDPQLESWLVFVSDSFNVKVLQVHSSPNNTYSLSYFATINAISLNLKEMLPLSLAATNYTVYLSDIANNVHVIGIDANGTVSLLGTHTVGYIVALHVSSDGSLLFALSSSGEFLVLNTLNFDVLRDVPPLTMISDAVTIYNRLVVSALEDWVAFPIYDGEHYTVRVLDLTPFNKHSEIYTSLGAGPLGLGQTGIFGALILLSEDRWTLNFAVLQYFQDYFTPLYFYRVLVAPNVTFYPSALHSETMQLHAYNQYSEYWSDPFTVNYLYTSCSGIPVPVNDDTPGSRSRSDFDHWYVWMILGLGTFILLAGAAFLTSRFQRRKSTGARDERLLSLPEVSKE